MALDVRKLRAIDLARLLNSTSAGEVVSEAVVRRHVGRAGFRVASPGDPDRIDLLRYVAWLAVTRHAAIEAKEKRAAGAGNGEDRWLSIAEASAAVVPAVTSDAVRKWCTAGLPFERTGGGGREIRIRHADLARWVAANKPSWRMAATPNGAGVEEARGDVEGRGDPRRTFEAALRLGEARARREDLRRQTDEIRLRRQLGELVSAAEVERVWSAQVGAFARGLARLPDQCLPGLARVVGSMLEGLGVPANKSAPAVEAVKAAFRAEVEGVTEILRAGLSEAPADNQEQDDGEE